MGEEEEEEEEEGGGLLHDAGVTDDFLLLYRSTVFKTCCHQNESINLEIS